MDKHALKRLAITLIVAIAIILLAKFMLTKTYVNLNKAAATKKQANIVQPPVIIQSLDSPAVSSVKPTDVIDISASSSVVNTAQ